MPRRQLVLDRAGCHRPCVACSPLIPLARVHSLPFERVQSWDIGPTVFVQLPSGSDQNIGAVDKCFPRGEVSDIYVPASLHLLRTRQLEGAGRQGIDNKPFLRSSVPTAISHLVGCLDKSCCPEPFGNIFEVLPNFIPWGVEIGPVGVWSKGILI